ncbi:oxysterol-binding protein-related protein 9-like [Uloborus diversus]|uniref:oxysterol-binding protein-related protein 9-like n=1 Tax=Uloborus diversus TaxID=327109 RepID=UPI00240A8CE6|nr:oxysterol-binding protein-related protein 9-like [Uloborus diversus]
MAIMEGPLSKWTNVMKGWQYRWFVLDDNAGLLSYYTSKEKMVRGARRGCVRLKGAIIGIDDEDDSTFTITVDEKTFHFQARDTDERDKWIHALQDTILRHTQCFSGQTRWNDLHSVSSSLLDFDKKLTEADAYLQLLIDQIKDLDNVISQCSSDADKTQLTAVRDSANNVLEAVKHSIVLLQIAKNTTHPVNGFYSVCNGPSSSEGKLKQSDKNESEGLKSLNEFIPDVECAVECSEDVNIDKLQGNLNLVVPETSYSSSDDEDFFDANEDAISSVQNPNIETANTGEERRLSHTHRLTSQDYDALYEDDEEELGSMGGQGSVISHLLSQVKIGMDLTKVVLPTFILERRSLLEMYADFFAHPDLFITIPDFDDPRDRFVQVIRWYLSAFHAGRKSSVAKKPYNPILGEIFRCFWHIPTIQEIDDSPKLVEEGPVPWATQDHLTFIAEQVSHHPPISAFYAEHVNKGISCTAHIWTKSKFLGLSIGVQNIGQAMINVLKHNEEYILTFPNGYGRSILNVPWIELGGPVTVSCPQTGYHSNIEFHTRPIYGGRKHRITAQMFAPSEKKPFVTVTGEWNGIMEAKWSTGETEVFVDTRTIPIIKKRVKPLGEQEIYESRKLWKDVTAALRIRNVEAATEAKFLLEQKQRQEAKDRLENKEKWETRAFHEIGENWMYDKSLQIRLSSKENPKQFVEDEDI